MEKKKSVANDMEKRKKSVANDMEIKMKEFVENDMGKKWKNPERIAWKKNGKIRRELHER